MTARPFLKWAGGKRWLAPDVLHFLPKRIEGTYYEPFLGGGAVFFALQELGALAGDVLLGDACPEVVEAFTQVRDNVSGLIRDLSGNVADEAEYYYVRDELHPRTAKGRAARTIYLNRTCFNGLHRVNSKGEFNVPWGKRVGEDTARSELLLDASEALRGCHIEHARAFDLIGDNFPGEGDVVYFDPPYLSEDRKGFTAYTVEGFSEAEHGALAELFRGCVEAGAVVCASVSDTPLMRRLYRRYKATTVDAARSGRISSNGAGRGPVGELLIFGGL